MEYSATIFYMLLFILAVKGKNMKGCPPPRECVPESECAQRIQLISEERLSKIILYECGNEMVCCIANPQASPLIQPRGLIKSEQANLLPYNCGVDFTYHLNKNESYALVDEFPWIVLLNITDKHNDKNRVVYCEGVLIHESYVLTTAQCIENVWDGYELGPIIFGEHNLMTDEDCYNYYSDKIYCAPPIQIRSIGKKFIHENYLNTVTSVKNNIALIKLNEKVNLNRNVQPVCLPINPLPKDPDNLLLAGWGKTSRESPLVSVLQKGQLFFIPLARCNEYIDSKKGMKIDKTWMCASGQSEVDSCKGNSGGPLLHARDHYKNEMTRWHLIGLVSHKVQDCGENSPTIFTNVEEYVDWILNKIEH